MPICPECGSEHLPEDMELTFLRPDDVAALSGEERSARVHENKDLCVLDGKRYFVRALLPLPVFDREHPYTVGLWVEVSQQSFMRVYELWDDTNQAGEPAFQATIANNIQIHPETRGLHGLLSLTGPTTRPKVALQPTEHPLFGEQNRGISTHRAAQYNSLYALGVA